MREARPHSNLRFLLFATLIAFALTASGQEIHVGPNGSDRNPGTREQPLASPDAALRKARESRRLKDPSASAGIRIVLHGGMYRLTQPLVVRSEDSGTDTAPTIVEAAPGERPVLSGGFPTEGWRKSGRVSALPSSGRRNVWVAETPKIAGRAIEFRQLWVNDRKAVRARQPNGDTLNRLLAWDRTREEAWIPASALGALRQPGR